LQEGVGPSLPRAHSPIQARFDSQSSLTGSQFVNERRPDIEERHTMLVFAFPIPFC